MIDQRSVYPMEKNDKAADAVAKLASLITHIRSNKLTGTFGVMVNAKSGGIMDFEVHSKERQ